MGCSASTAEKAPGILVLRVGLLFVLVQLRCLSSLPITVQFFLLPKALNHHLLCLSKGPRGERGPRGSTGKPGPKVRFGRACDGN